MAFVPETPGYEEGIFQLEYNTPAIGGPPTVDVDGNATGGHDNVQAMQLANRTAWLEAQRIGTQNGQFINNGVLGSIARNCALAGPSDATSGRLIVIRYKSPTQWAVPGHVEPIIVTFAAGFDATTGRPVDYVERIDTEMVATTGGSFELPDNTFAFIERDVDTFALTLGETLLEPIYNIVEPTTPATDQLWYHPGRGLMYRYDGADWINVQVVMLGELPYSGTPGNLMTTLVRPYQLNAGPSAGDKMPIGAIVALGYPPVENRLSIPRGWLLCNGAEISRKDYSLLFDKLQSAYGNGDGTTTFDLPDMRGEFLRGWDDGRGVDTGRLFGNAQAEDIGPHKHDFSLFALGVGGSVYPATSAGIALPETGSTHLDGLNIGTETRPRNIAVYWIIRYD